jgi:hypothetical protein
VSIAREVLAAELALVRQFGGGRLSRLTGGISPRLAARLAGVFQLLEAVLATYGQVIVLGKLIVTGNAGATASNILAHERLFWAGFVCSVLGVLFHVAWAALMYHLLKPVSRLVSLVAAFTIAVGCAVQAVTCLLYLAPLPILRSTDLLKGFTGDQLQGLSFVFIKLNGQAFNLYLVFFGLWCLLTGYLIYRSTFFPRFLGALLSISGVGWMFYLFPSLANSVFPFIAAASAVGEIPLELWCIVKGVNSERWNEQAKRAYQETTLRDST